MNDANLKMKVDAFHKRNGTDEIGGHDREEDYEFSNKDSEDFKLDYSLHFMSSENKVVEREVKATKIKLLYSLIFILLYKIF